MPPDLATDGSAIVAILRGVTPERVAGVGEVLFEAGIRAIEVPLNSPEPFKSIEILAKALGERCLCGAGTVLDADDVPGVKDAGGRLVVSPNTNEKVIAACVARDLLVMPGFATATEAFTAIGAGARYLKLFPARTYGPAHLKALKAVLPKDVAVYAVGGVSADDVADWIGQGAAGFGFGSELFHPDYTNEEISARAKKLVAAVSRAIRK
jgi:2-dehydro-3-deoxyphosphogalactonate aldolase